MAKKKVNFEKFDKAEKEIKEAEDAVQDLAAGFEEGAEKRNLTRAALDLEKAEIEIEEVDEESF